MGIVGLAVGLEGRFAELRYHGVGRAERKMS